VIAAVSPKLVVVVVEQMKVPVGAEAEKVIDAGEHVKLVSSTGRLGVMVTLVHGTIVLRSKTIGFEAPPATPSTHVTGTMEVPMLITFGVLTTFTKMRPGDMYRELVPVRVVLRT